MIGCTTPGGGYEPHKVIPIQQGLKRDTISRVITGATLPHKVIPIQQGLKR